MIIPIKCFTCGFVLADKYRYYCSEVLKRTEEQNMDKIVYFTTENHKKTEAGNVLDELKIYKMCCRRHFLTHVDIE